METMLEAVAAIAGEVGIPVALALCTVCALAWKTLSYRTLWRRERDEHAHARALVHNLTEGIYRSSIDGRQLSANPALVRLNGYSTEAEMLASVADIGTEWYVEPGRRDEFSRLLHRDGRIDDFVSEIYRHKTRERIWVTESARIVRNPRTGEPIFYEGSVREITETVKRLKLEEHYKKLINQVPGGIFQYAREADGSFQVLYFSAGFLRITGIPLDTPFAKPDTFTRLIVPEDMQAYEDSLRACFRQLSPWDHEFRIRTPDGVEKWIRATAMPERTGDRVIWHGYMADISVRKGQELRIRELAYFDPLTRLPNRRMLLDRLAEVMPTVSDAGRRGALLFIDLDNFKTLNDSQGHDVGDAYLVQVAERLKCAVDVIDMVARIGGDEFVVVIENAGADEATATRHVLAVANRILAETSRVYRMDMVEHRSSASVGLVVFDGSESRVDEILKRADIAMYNAKNAGRNAVAIFDPEAQRREAERFKLVADLRRAVAEDQFVLHFQPQMDRDGAVYSAEALLRWYHPERGVIPPARFLALAEQSGLICDIGRLVLEKGVATLASWQQAPETAHLRLSLNVSIKAFEASDFVPFLFQLIERYRVDASRLVLEFTEQVIAQHQDAAEQRMRELKRRGITFSLDDFGTGYSSLAYLRKLPFDEVKIDGGFVSELETRESDRALVRTILAMADTLGLTAVAEHVENARQESFLRAFGCDLYQGYFYSPPIELDHFMSFVRERMPAHAEKRIA